MKKDSCISALYYASAAYDGILGLVFLVIPLSVYNWFGVIPPNHLGYIHFPAALLIVFAVMFINIARHPLRNRNLILYGILLKISYCSVVFWHWFTGGIPGMWKPFSLFDLLFLLLFIWSYFALEREAGDNH